MVLLIANWIVNALALYIVSKIVPGVYVSDFISALVAVIVIGFVNAIVKPILLFLTLPISILTLGLFTFIVNAAMLLLASLVAPGFKVDGFSTALIASIVLSVVSVILHALTR